MTHPSSTDPRVPELVSAHRTLACEILTAESRRQSLRRNRLEASEFELRFCPTRLEIDADIDAELRADFFDDDSSRCASFHGHGAGSLLSSHCCYWGDSCLLRPLTAGESLTLSCMVNDSASLLTVLWWSEDGVFACFAGLSPARCGGLLGGAGHAIAV
jgi:hypothetical protein